MVGKKSFVARTSHNEKNWIMKTNFWWREKIEKLNGIELDSNKGKFIERQLYWWRKKFARK